MKRQTQQRDRGQAFTLEGFIGAIIVLIAVVFALQAVVLTPTTGGAVDRTAQAQTEREVMDTLLVAANEGELSKIVRYWDPDERLDGTFHNATATTDAAYNNSVFAAETDFGAVLDRRFVDERGNSYNVDLIAYDEAGDRVTERLVRMGDGSSSDAVSTSYAVTVYDDSTLTRPASNGIEADTSTNVSHAWDESAYPIPPGATLDESAVYNVVEVRVTVW